MLERSAERRDDAIVLFLCALGGLVVEVAVEGQIPKEITKYFIAQRNIRVYANSVFFRNARKYTYIGGKARDRNV